MRRAFVPGYRECPACDGYGTQSRPIVHTCTYCDKQYPGMVKVCDYERIKKGIEESERRFGPIQIVDVSDL